MECKESFPSPADLFSLRLRRFGRMAAAAGFEPALPESKSGVLPLHNAALKFWCRRRESNPYTLGVGDFKSPVSASSTTAARCLYFFALLAIAAEIVVGYLHAEARQISKPLALISSRLRYTQSRQKTISTPGKLSSVFAYTNPFWHMKVFIPRQECI